MSLPARAGNAAGSADFYVSKTADHWPAPGRAARKFGADAVLTLELVALRAEVRNSVDSLLNTIFKSY